VLEAVTEAGLEWPIAGDETGCQRAREHPQEQEQRGAAPQVAECRRFQGECIVQRHLADLA
jgi:hypothetical protein